MQRMPKLILTEEQIIGYAAKLQKLMGVDKKTALGLVVRNQKNIEDMIAKLQQVDDE